MDNDGLLFTLKQSKIDSLGRGTTIQIGCCNPPMCTASAMATYLILSSGSPWDPPFRYQDGRYLSKNAFVEEVCHLLKAAAI